MKFALLVDGSPYHSSGAASACRFARAALAKGHAVSQVFFYGDGVYNAMAFAHPPADEAQFVDDWRELAREHGVDLVLCGAAAERRGVLGESDASLTVFSGVAEGFRVAGLGLWVDACLAVDRVVAFHG